MQQLIDDVSFDFFLFPSETLCDRNGIIPYARARVCVCTSGARSRNILTRNSCRNRSSNGSVDNPSGHERQRLIDALAAASVVTNSASPRADGKQKCIDVTNLADFLEHYQDQSLSKEEIVKLIQVSAASGVYRLMTILVRWELIGRIVGPQMEIKLLPSLHKTVPSTASISSYRLTIGVTLR